MRPFPACLALLLAPAVLAQTATSLGDLNPAATPIGSSPQGFTALDAGVVFFGLNAQQRMELWRTDGTAAGTTRLSVVGQTLGQPLSSTASRLFFVGDDATGATQLWVTDGTAAGTAVVAPQGVYGPGGSTMLGDVLLFDGIAPGTSVIGLWRSDGTAAGTYRVADAVGDGGSYLPRELTPLGARVAFTLYLPTTGSELWSTDGTAAGTSMVTDLSPGAGNSTDPYGLVSAGGRLYFQGVSLPNGPLLSWDGTGSTITTVMSPPPPNYQAGWSADFLGNFVFHSNASLYSYSGTGSPSVVAGFVGSLANLFTVGPLLYAVGDNNGALSVWDGGVDPPLVVVPAGVTFVAAPFKGGLLYQDRGPSTSDNELGYSDGTVAGSGRIADLRPGNLSSNPRGFTPVGGVAVFAADDGVHGEELWRTDGTGAGTALVKDLVPVARGQGSYPSHFQPWGGTVLFGASLGPSPSHVWATTGTAASTAPFLPATNDAGLPFTGDFLVFQNSVFTGAPAGSSSWALVQVPLDGGASTSTSTCSGSLSGLVATSAGVFFSCPGVGAGSVIPIGLWFADGVSAPRYLTQFTGGVSPGTLTPFGDRLLFTVAGSGSSALWVSDGTPAGTRSLSGQGGRPTVIGGVAHFAVPPNELWRTDGTLALSTREGSFDAGVFAVAALGPGLVAVAGRGVFLVAADGGAPVPLASFSAAPTALTSLGTLAVFVAADDAGLEPWTTDGTAAGTQRLLDVNPGPAGSGPSELFSLGSVAYFTADDGVHGAELWRTDGTTRGTRLVQDLDPGPGSTWPSGFALLGGALYFEASPFATGPEPWVMPVDSTPPTVMPTIGVDGGAWYTTDVPVSFAVGDPESPIDFRSADCAGVTISTDTPGTTLTCEATSQGGRTVSSVFVRRDATPPTIACPAPITAATDAGREVVAWPAADAGDALSSVAIRYDRDPAQPVAFPGATVTATATDEAGNEASCSFAVTLKDVEAPTVTCLSSPVVLEPTDRDGVAVTSWPQEAARGTDVVDPASVRLEYSPAAPLTLAVNSTTDVEVVAVDGSGNRSEKCTFHVSVACTSDACRAQQAEPVRSRYRFGCASADAAPMLLFALGVLWRFRRSARPLTSRGPPAA